MTEGGEGRWQVSEASRSGKVPRLRPLATGPHHGTHWVRQNSPPPTSVAAESCLRRQRAIREADAHLARKAELPLATEVSHQGQDLPGPLGTTRVSLCLSLLPGTSLGPP